MITTRIETVTLYKNGALVERSGRASAGLVEVERLPLLLSWSTFRVRPALGTVTDVVESATVETDDGAATTSDVVAKANLVTELNALRQQLESIQRLQNGLARAKPVDTQSDRPPLNDLAMMPHWAEIPDWIEEESHRYVQRRVVLETTIREKERQLAVLDGQHPRVTSPARAYRGATFQFGDLPPDVEVPFTIEYFVPAARWVPTYALDLDGDRGQLTLFAMVANATGESWTGAKLAFSTVDLARETTLPEVLSWRIGRAQDKRRPAYRALPNDLEALFDAYDRGQERASTPLTPVVGKPPPAPPSAPPPAPMPQSAPPGNAPLRSAPMAVAFGGSAPFADDDDHNDKAALVSQESLEMPDMFMDMPEEMPKMARLERSAAAPQKKRKAKEAVETITAGVTEPLPPSLRTMSMRLLGPHEAHRGTLKPLGEREHVMRLVDATAAPVLERAFATLDRAAEGLWHRSLPQGTEALSDATPPTLFHGTSLASVPDDGEFHRVAVQQMHAHGEAELRVVPRESDDVFRFYLFDLAPGVSLPDGPLDVSEGGTFRVRSRVRATASARRIELNLGVEPGVRVLGRVARVRQEEKGLMSAASLIDHTVELTLRSTLSTSSRLRVFDRLPTPDANEKEVEVTLLKSEPPCIQSGTAPDGGPLVGGLEWKLVVESGETLKVVHAYQIKLPAKTEVVGGNRRE